MDETVRRDLLKAEYLNLRDTLQSFDTRILTIKAWSVTVSVATIGYAFVAHVGFLLLIASASSVLFWLVESLWKTFQYAHYSRLDQLERYFAGTEVHVLPMQSGDQWYRSWKHGGIRRLATVLIWPHVALPHAVVCFAGILVYVLTRTGLVAL